MRIVPAALACLAFAAVAAARTGDSAKAFAEGHATHYSLRAYDAFGIRVQPLPDLDGDGIDDFAFGSFSLASDASGVLSSGDLAIHSGADGRRVHLLSSPGSTTLFPDALADAGDVDGDGTHDLAVGMTSSNADIHRGAVTLFSGRDARVIRRLEGELGRQRYGDAITGMPDADGDGVPELLVGAPVTNGLGRLYLHSGASGALLRTIDAPPGAVRFGTPLARLRDVDGDRIDDVVVGAATPDSDDPGRVYVLSGADYAIRHAIVGPPDGLGFGARVGSAGDFDGDGRGDFYVADPAAGGDVRTGGPGRYRIYSGASGAVVFERSGSQPREQLGQPGEAFDYDGDGTDDVVIGRRPGNATEAGSFAVHAGPDGRVLATYTNDLANDRIGSRIATLGDIDGDGRHELLATTFGSPDPRIVVAAGAVAAHAPLVAPAPHHTGLWVDPAHNGEGFALEMLADGRAAVYWFTFTRGGAQRYLLGLAAPVGRRLVFDALLATRGGRLGGAFAPGDVALTDRARLVLSFDGCDSGFAEYTVDGERERQRLVRLTGVPALACHAAPATAEDYSGAWYDTAHPGEGWVVQSIGDGRYAVLWFTYGADGAQQWFTTLAVREGARLLRSELLRPAGGRFGPYFDPAEVARPVWGTLTIEFADCNRARIAWDGTEARGEAQVQRLTRLAGLACAR
ncbi:MAG TPA: integrin alpha [Xanthomonadales bacterium]|nr:integrin alpha [Xanthomonadales bacterium]